MEEQTKQLIDRCISEQITKAWIEIRTLTNQFLDNNSFLKQIDLIKCQTFDLFIQQNISYQRVKTDKKPTEGSAKVAKQMIDNIIQLFKTDQKYKGYELKQLQLILLLLQRISIYYSCFTLQLPLFESANDLLRKIEANTVTTITTSTGSGKVGCV